METVKWLKRKYPKSFDLLMEYFDRHEIERFKKSRMRIGILTKDIFNCKKYKKGSVLQFKKSNPVNDYNHPYSYLVLKCDVGFTESGYHSFNVKENCYKEITE